MRLFGYYLIHTVVNGVKKLFRTWVAVLLGSFLLCGVIGGVIGVAVGTFTENADFGSSYEEYEETPEEDLELTPEEKQQMLSFVELAAGGIILLVLLTNVYTADKSGTNIFIMADVNFLFTAPLKPQSVLLFRVLLQMGTTIVASVYLLFQLPNLIMNLGLSVPMAVSILGCWLLTIMLGKLLAVLVYTLIATHDGLRKYVRLGVFGIAGALALAVYAVMKLKNLSIWSAALWLFGSKGSRLVPGWGWLKGMVGYAIDGNMTGVLLCVLGVILLGAVLTYVTWRIKADFYEDALAHAAELQETQAAAAEGRGAKRKKERADRLRRDGLFGRGAAVFLTRGIYNHHRFGKLRLFSGTGITYAAVFIGIAAALRLFAEGADIAGMLAIPAAIVAGIAFFRNLGNPLEEDMRGHLLYLVPEKPGRKILCAMLAGSYDTLLDVTPGLLVATILLGASWLQALGWLAVILTLDFMVSATGLLLQMGLPSSLPEQVHALLQLMLKMVLLLLPIGVLLAVSLLSTLTAGLLLTAALNLLVGGVLLLPARAMLHGGKN